MPPLVDALAGSWYWAMSLCECSCRHVLPQMLTLTVKSWSTKAILETVLESSKHIPEVCDMYRCVFGLKVSVGSWGSVLPLNKSFGLSLVDELFFETLRLCLSSAC